MKNKESPEKVIRRIVKEHKFLLEQLQAERQLVENKNSYIDQLKLEMKFLKEDHEKLIKEGHRDNGVFEAIELVDKFRNIATNSHKAILDVIYEELDNLYLVK